MSKKYFHWLPALAMLFAVILSACSAEATAKQIATYPSNTPVLIGPEPENTIVVYRAYLELMVSNVDQSAERASQMAYDRGGYLASSQSWYTDERKNTTLVLAVPTVNFESLRRALLGLGELVSESVSGEEIHTNYPYGQIPYSHITLQLRQKTTLTLPTIDPPGWNPGRTFEHAFSVFLTIFGFLADILIWVTVVGGPFLLIFLIARVIIRRSRRRP